MLAIYRRHVEGIVANLLRNEEPKNLLFLKDPGILDALEAFTSLFPSEQLLVTIRKPAAILASRRDVAKRAAKPFDLKIALNCPSSEFSGEPGRFHNGGSGSVSFEV